MIVLGSHYGFRGRKEHALLNVSQVVIVTINEPRHKYHGFKCVEVRDLLDKSNKLTIHNHYTRDGKYLRYPIRDMNDPSDNIACIARYLEKISPMQTRFYCKEASPQMKDNFAEMGFPKAAMSPKQPLGENKVAEMIASGCRRCGLGDCKGQGLRRIFVTTLANAQGVSEKERLASSRHNSVAAQLTYQTRNTSSEAAKFDAVLGKLKN